MSLTGHLRDRASPVRAWFAVRLSATSSLVHEANHELRRPHATSSDTPSRPGVAFGPALPSTAVSPQLVGTALDLLVRATLAPVARARYR